MKSIVENFTLPYIRVFIRLNGVFSTKISEKITKCLRRSQRAKYSRGMGGRLGTLPPQNARLFSQLGT